MKRLLPLLPLLLSGSAYADSYEVAIYKITGELSFVFPATDDDVIGGQLEAGPNNFIYVSHSSWYHKSGELSEQDGISFFSSDGAYLDTLQGGDIQSPEGFHVQEDGSVITTGFDTFFNSHLYRFDNQGNFVERLDLGFASPIERYQDVHIKADGRSYASAWSGSDGDKQMAEFSTDGQTTRTFSATGPAFLHEDIAEAPDGSIWVRTSHNGEGASDMLKHFDANGTPLGEFSTEKVAPNLVGLEVNDQGQLLSLATDLSAIYTMAIDGGLIGITYLDGLETKVADFTLLPSGNLAVLRAQPLGNDCGNDSRGPFDHHHALVANFLWVTAAWLRRRQRKKLSSSTSA